MARKIVTPTRQSWMAMRQRCRDAKHVAWSRYGGRGITVCERWQVFENFLADMGERPPGRSLDRINNDGNYEPGNCRWATPQEQLENSDNSYALTVGGTTKTIAEWARFMGVGWTTIAERIRRGWDVADAIATPPFPSKTSRSDGLAIRSKAVRDLFARLQP